MRTFLLVLLAALPVCAQGGLPPEWEVRKQLATLAENVARFEPLLEKLNPQTWEGAPSGYAEQVNRARAEIGHLITTTRSLERQPERMTLALEAYFRIVAVDQMLRSLEAGVRKYQNPAIADLLQSLIAGATADREKLRQYIVELAADREAQFRAIDEEAQRCRAALSRQPPKGTARKEQSR
jgi:hypothetical protein